MGIIKTDEAPAATPTIREYMDSELTIRLTRRELFYLRKMNSRRIDTAMQGMNAMNASPAKRSMRYEEYKFHRDLSERLHGIYDKSGEVRREHDDELAYLIDKYEKQSAQCGEFAESLRKRIGNEA